MGRIINPHDLRVRAEEDNPPFTYHGGQIKLVAKQVISRKGNKIDTEYYYAVETKTKKPEKLILFNKDPTTSIFNVAGLRTRSVTAKGIQLLSSELYEKIVEKPDKKWLKENRFILEGQEESIEEVKEPTKNSVFEIQMNEFLEKVEKDQNITDEDRANILEDSKSVEDNKGFKKLQKMYEKAIKDKIKADRT